MPRPYVHLAHGERRNLTEQLGRNPTTLYRELKRNHHQDAERPQLSGYHAVAAQTGWDFSQGCTHSRYLLSDTYELRPLTFASSWTPCAVSALLGAAHLARNSNPSPRIGRQFWG